MGRLYICIFLFSNGLTAAAWLFPRFNDGERLVGWKGEIASSQFGFQHKTSQNTQYVVPSAEHDGETYASLKNFLHGCRPTSLHSAPEDVQWLHAQARQHLETSSSGINKRAKYESFARFASKSLRVFVYDVPEKFTQQLLDQPVDLHEMSVNQLQRLPSGGFEVTFHKFLMEHQGSESLTITADPNEAHLFFIPFYASNSMKTKKLTHAHLYEQLIEHLRKTAPYWDRLGGADHFLALGRHYTERTAFGQTSIDLAMMQPGPILLLFEFTNFKPSHLRSNLWLYAKHVVVPRPDPYTGAVPAAAPEVQRPLLMAYIGSVISPFRSIMVHAIEQLRHQAQYKVHIDGFCHDKRLERAEAMQAGERSGVVGAAEVNTALVYRMADFCPCPRGDARTDSRFYDAIRAGCIPVVFDRLRASAFSNAVNYTGFVVMADHVSNVPTMRQLMEELAAMTLEEKARRRTHMAAISPLLNFDPSVEPNAFLMIANELAARAAVVTPWRGHYAYNEPFEDLKSTSHKTAQRVARTWLE
ncbi:hypothetical protein CYMTET_4854 [Cymbomonas tetramitiformis]|uniref:Exostosin GT47 domain-containing protein n=1 Tax=Cymbomonas tetramitiformis TaxID=36881 RepID=A0AAE0LJY9_9CHLO|nr:hypothetical protein CYMTET_4854 [Cymbomonas tetramitiformis]